MIEIGLGSVQTWECDVMGHLNIQHYVARMTESLGALGLALGIAPRRAREEGVEFRAVHHHIRFLRELRPGTPFIILGGVIEVRDDVVRLYQELRQTHGGAVSATFVTDAALLDLATGARRALPGVVAGHAEALRMAVPEHAVPRGIELRPPRPSATWDEAERLGLLHTQQGAVGAVDCDHRGFMVTRAYIARISDSIANLVVRSRLSDRVPTTAGGEGPRTRDLGGAALEYRIVYRSVPRAGDVLAVRSGVTAVGAKAMSWVHWLIDRETGEAVATAEQVNVTLDLETRRAVEVSPATRRGLEAHLKLGLTA